MGKIFRSSEVRRGDSVGRSFGGMGERRVNVGCGCGWGVGAGAGFMMDGCGEGRGVMRFSSFFCLRLG